MDRSENIDQLAAALCSVQGELRNPPKDQTAEIRSKKGAESSFSFRYASLAEILEQVRPLLAGNGLSLIQELSSKDTAAGFYVGVGTMLIHSSGQWVELEPFLLPIGGGAEARDYGAVTSYARRYAIKALLNIVEAEDETAAGKPCGAPRKATPAQLRKLAQEAAKAGLTPKQVDSAVHADYKRERREDLLVSEASELIERIMTWEKVKAEQKPPVCDENGEVVDEDLPGVGPEDLEDAP